VARQFRCDLAETGPFVGRCLISLTMPRFHTPAYRTGQAQLAHPARRKCHAVAHGKLSNYAGTGAGKVARGSTAYEVINAPNAALKFTGGSNFYGSAIGATVDDTGGTSLHFDTTLMNNVPAPAANLVELSLREVSY